MRLKPLLPTAPLLLLCGCILTFNHAVTPTPKERVAPSPYLGVWKLARLLGSTPSETMFFLVQKKGDKLKVITSTSRNFSKPGATPPVLVQLMQMGSHTVAFSQDEGKRGWKISRFVFKQNKRQLTIETLVPKKLEADIKKGRIKGEITPELQRRISRQTSVHITASSNEVRNYVIQHAQFAEACILTRMS